MMCAACMSVCVPTCFCMCVCVHVSRSEDNLRCHFSGITQFFWLIGWFYFWDNVSHGLRLSYSARLTSHRQFPDLRIYLSALPSTGVISNHHIIFLYMRPHIKGDMLQGLNNSVKGHIISALEFLWQELPLLTLALRRQTWSLLGSGSSKYSLLVNNDIGV